MGRRWDKRERGLDIDNTFGELFSEEQAEHFALHQGEHMGGKIFTEDEMNQHGDEIRSRNMPPKLEKIFDPVRLNEVQEHFSDASDFYRTNFRKKINDSHV